MTEHEQRIAIAEWMGWRFPEPDSGMCLYPDGSRVQDSLVPDYTRDLNAMHEAEVRLVNQFTLEHEQFWRYLQHVQPHSIFATAAQRAEALLRTLNLWRDEPPAP